MYALEFNSIPEDGMIKIPPTYLAKLTGGIKVLIFPLESPPVASDTTLRRDMIAISQRCAALPDLDTRSPEEILGYNEIGGLD
jgi:hypothetical protein